MMMVTLTSTPEALGCHRWVSGAACSLQSQSPVTSLGLGVTTSVLASLTTSEASETATSSTERAESMVLERSMEARIPFLLITLIGKIDME